MDTVTILEKPETLLWDYDEDADVLYLSIGDPQPAVGIDMGEGMVLRYNEGEKSIVGLTIMGLRARLPKELTTAN